MVIRHRNRTPHLDAQHDTCRHEQSRVDSAVRGRTRHYTTLGTDLAKVGIRDGLRASVHTMYMHVTHAGCESISRLEQGRVRRGGSGREAGGERRVANA